MDQFAEGLQCCGFLAFLRENLSLGFHLLAFRKPRELTADFVLDLFEPVLSERDSNTRMIEEAIVMNWNDFIKDVANKGLLLWLEYIIRNVKCLDIFAGTELLTLQHIMEFATGAQNVPVVGFYTKPMLAFDLEATSERRCLTASTCTMKIVFTRRHNVDYDAFKDDVAYGILNSHGFNSV